MNGNVLYNINTYILAISNHHILIKDRGITYDQ